MLISLSSVALYTVFSQSVEVSRLLWLLAVPRTLPVSLLLRAAAVAPWGWEVWELLDLVWKFGSIPAAGAGLEAAEWSGECLVSPWCLWLGWAAAMPRRGGWAPFPPSLPGHGPVSSHGDSTANLSRQLLWLSDRHWEHPAQQVRFGWNLLQEPAIEAEL